jgi:hypothetical protein
VPKDDRNSDQRTNQNRDQAYEQHGHHDQSVEEYPPARYRDPNEEMNTKDVPIDEQHCDYLHLPPTSHPLLTKAQRQQER